MKPFFNQVRSLSSVSPARSAGFALISTLLIIAVLTIMVVAFMQSMRIDRLTARSYVSKTKAQLLAEGAADLAEARITQTLVSNPYNATGYTNMIVGSDTISVPVLYGATGFTNTPVPYYLLSGTNAAVLPNFTATNSDITRPLLTEMNTKRSLTDQAGRMGSPVDASGTMIYRSLKAPWIYVLKDPALPEQPKPTLPNYNPVIGRYAYWIEDESSKIPYSVAGNKEGAGNTFQRNVDTRLPQDIDIGALPMDLGKPLATDASGGVINKAIVDFYSTVPNTSLKYSDGSLINYAGNGVATNTYDLIRFYGTPYSQSLEVAGTGKRRVNINGLVTNSSATADIQANIDDLGYVITGKHLYPNSTGALFKDEADLTSDQPLPNFGLRFFPAAPAAPTTAQKDIYIKKIAANIRDYIDTDFQPTYIDFSGAVISGTKPTSGWADGESPQALGKEAVPVFQEHMWRGKEVSWSLAGSTSSFKLEFYQYFEFLNPSTKDWVAPSGTFLKAYSLPTWEGSSTFKPKDFEVDLSGETFPAGKVTVISTDPSPPSGMIQTPGKIITRALPTAADFTWTGTSSLSATVDSATTKGVVRLSGRNSQYTDYQSEMVFGTGLGIVDSHPYLAIAGGTYVWAHAGKYTTPASKQNEGIFFSSSLRGNDANGRSGDPRSQAEQLTTRAGSSSFGNDQSRFFGNVQKILDSTHSLGKAAMSFVDPAGAGGKIPWPDFTQAFDDTPSTAYEFIRDAPMKSIGELGNIYDPKRVAGENGIVYSRGGGRTLKVGQNDDVISGVRFSNTWQNASWRLCDLFGVDQDITKKFVNTTANGKININGVLRDNGVALKAALRKFVFAAAPDSDKNLANQSITDTEITAMITSIKTYLTTNGPMMERGELSQITYFAPNTPTLGGRAMSTINDRGREELFRRTVELITTRSGSYTVYVSAEALSQASNGTLQKLSRQNLRRTFSLTPQIADAPNSKVTSYRVETINETQ